MYQIARPESLSKTTTLRSSKSRSEKIYGIAPVLVMKFLRAPHYTRPATIHHPIGRRYKGERRSLSVEKVIFASDAPLSSRISSGNRTIAVYAVLRQRKIYGVTTLASRATVTLCSAVAVVSTATNFSK